MPAKPTLQPLPSTIPASQNLTIHWDASVPESAVSITVSCQAMAQTFTRNVSDSGSYTISTSEMQPKIDAVGGMYNLTVSISRYKENLVNPAFAGGLIRSSNVSTQTTTYIVP